MYIALVLVGACFGSFAGATVWRLRARQLRTDKKNGERVDSKEYNRLEPLATTKIAKDHSRCLNCSYTLKWYDLIPVVSWLALRGRCRNCRKPIGRMEILIELGMIAFFVLSYVLWPFDLNTSLDTVRFLAWLAAGVVMGILFVYDVKWFLLPDKANLALVTLGAITLGITAAQSGDVFATILSALGAVGILSGIYGVLYLASGGKWIGLGDVKLGVGLALLLVDWQLALIALFFANFVGCLIVIPLLATGKLKRQSHVPFGPLLIIGMILAQFFGMYILSFYVGTLI